MTTKPRAEPPCILIVDDTRENRDLLEVLLMSVECTLLTAQDGATALAIAANQHLDLILCDVMMPGMTGYEVVLRLRADPATRDIPVIICSALDDANSRSHATNVGADDVISKPLWRAELLPCVEKWLKGRGLAGQPAPPNQPTYFTATTGLMGGRRFRVYDVRLVAGHSKVVDVGSSEATHRTFVQADRGRWTYRFVVADSRMPDPASLERQLHAATYRTPSTV